eukprot:5261906-Pyramimonas_sp.AAC.1
MLQSACSLRFGVPSWRVNEPCVVKELASLSSTSKDSFTKMAKSVKKFLATEVKLNGPVPWVASAEAVIAGWKQEKEDSRAQHKKETVSYTHLRAHETGAYL